MANEDARAPVLINYLFSDFLYTHLIKLTFNIRRTSFRIERGVEPVADDVERQHERGEGEAWEGDDPPRIADEMLSVVEHIAPTDLAAVADADEFERGFEQDHAADHQRYLRDYQRKGVRQYFVK